jgi:hypothetical protein
VPDGFSDEEDVDEPGDVQGIEDSDDEDGEFGCVDWARFEVGENGELSAWDQLGAGYDTEFANIGK